MPESVVTTIDVREIVPVERHSLIFGRFTWDYLESGPAVWRVRIGKLIAAVAIPAASSGSCCSGGSCG